MKVKKKEKICQAAKEEKREEGQTVLVNW